MDINQGNLWAVEGTGVESEPQLLARLAEPLSVALPRVGGGWMCGTGTKVIALDDVGRTVARVTVESAGVRMNDGKADPAGRFWVGSKAHDNAVGRGSLWRIDLDGSVTRMLTGLTIANGIGWSPDGRAMYITDSAAHRIDVHEFDSGSGSLGEARPFVRLADELGEPDGLTVDGNGDVWVAVWGGRCVRRYSPDGVLTGQVGVSTQLVSSCTFAGDDLSLLIITTAQEGLSDHALAEDVHAGRLYTAQVGVRGLPEPLVKVDLSGWSI